MAISKRLQQEWRECNWLAGPILAPYPFVRDEHCVEGVDHDGLPLCIQFGNWRPGTRMESRGLRAPYYEEEIIDCLADGMGQIELTAISIHRPGKFPTRVFFTRHWIDPDGKRFGKNKLRMTTVNAFAALTTGYRHDFEMAKVTT